jgi:hypothetical protein
VIDRDTEEKGAAAAFKGLSKVTYATSSSDMDINLDDDNFWEKILPEMKTSKSLAARVAAGQVETEAQREEFIRDITALVEEVKEGMMSRSASYAYQSAHSGRELHAFLVKLITHKSFTDKVLTAPHTRRTRHTRTQHTHTTHTTHSTHTRHTRMYD